MGLPAAAGAPVLREMTLCLPVEGQPATRVLLGLKRAGFGAGKLAGFGGKIEAGETPAVAAARELWEETGLCVQPADLSFAGHLIFLFPHRPAWSQLVHLFLALCWTGEPAASDEMEPAWFAAGDVPYERMWQDGRHWLPRALAGETLRATFTFQADDETVERVEIEPWDGSRTTGGNEEA